MDKYDELYILYFDYRASHIDIIAAAITTSR